MPNRWVYYFRVFEKVRGRTGGILISGTTRWANSKTLEVIDSVFSVSNMALANIPENDDPGISISSKDPAVASQITINSIATIQRGMVIHSNFNAVSTVSLDSLFLHTSSVTPQDFFFDATGAVTAVALGAASQIECTAAGHNILDGDIVTHTDFTDANYLGDFVASDVVEGVSYEVVATFVVTDTGTWTNLSLNQTDPRITSIANEKISIPNSMTLAEAITNGMLVVSGELVGVPGPVIDTTPASGDWIEDPTTERFTVDDTTGIITYNGSIDIAVEMKYRVVTNTPNPAQIIEFHLRLDGVEQAKTLVTLDTSNDNNGTYIGGIFTLSTGDTVQLFKTNTTSNIGTDIEATVLVLAI